MGKDDPTERGWGTTEYNQKPPIPDQPGESQSADDARQDAEIQAIRHEIEQQGQRLTDIEKRATEYEVKVGVRVGVIEERADGVRKDVDRNLEAFRTDTEREWGRLRDTVTAELNRRGEEAQKHRAETQEAVSKASASLKMARENRQTLSALVLINRILSYIGKHKKKFGWGTGAAGGLTSLIAMAKFMGWL